MLKGLLLQPHGRVSEDGHLLNLENAASLEGLEVVRSDDEELHSAEFVLP